MGFGPSCLSPGIVPLCLKASLEFRPIFQEKKQAPNGKTAERGGLLCCSKLYLQSTIEVSKCQRAHAFTSPSLSKSFRATESLRIKQSAFAIGGEKGKKRAMRETLPASRRHKIVTAGNLQIVTQIMQREETWWRRPSHTARIRVPGGGNVSVREAQTAKLFRLKALKQREATSRQRKARRTLPVDKYESAH